jgi:hypothetical protein
MQEERKDQVEDSEEVEAHRRFGPSEEPPARSDQADEDEVEAHRMQRGPEEFGKRF